MKDFGHAEVVRYEELKKEKRELCKGFIKSLEAIKEELVDLKIEKEKYRRENYSAPIEYLLEKELELVNELIKVKEALYSLEIYILGKR